MNASLKAQDQLLVEGFMARLHANAVGARLQALPTSPEIPSEDVRLLRARLVFEEALELIVALGCTIRVDTGLPVVHTTSLVEPNLVKIADGCADLSVVNLGTASACGFALAPIFNAVAENNLRKFAPGHALREDGKLIKPLNHPSVGPELAALLRAQGANLP